MPKLHGGGGHGRVGREKQRSFESQLLAAERLERQHAAFVRKVERKTEAELKEISDMISKRLKQVSAQIDAKKVTLNIGCFQFLALCEWYSGRIVGLQIVTVSGNVRAPTQEECNLFAKQSANILMVLRKRHVSERELKAQVAKWKRRVEDPHFWR